jgi:hypothetical protein
MNSDKFTSREDIVTFLDLTARFNFKTTNSLSFTIERYSKSLLPVRQMGWFDLHYPCEGHIKLQIRVSLPSEYHADDKLDSIIAVVLSATEIPADETYEAYLFAETGTIISNQPVNREGYTNRI